MAWRHFYDSARAHPYVMPDSDRVRLRRYDSVRIVHALLYVRYLEKEVTLTHAIHDSEELRFRTMLAEKIEWRSGHPDTDAADSPPAA